MAPGRHCKARSGAAGEGTKTVMEFDEKIVIVVLSLDQDVSIEIKKRRANEARKKKEGVEVGEERKLFADGTGMRFNRVKEGWVVASLTRFGRAKLSGD
jgi:hypothetical protein